MKRNLMLMLSALLLAITPLVSQAETVEETPSGLKMAGDLLIARPIGITIFALGSVTYVATLPFSLAGGNAGEAGKTLVLEPAREAFVRCLGCTRSGYKERLKESD